MKLRVLRTTKVIKKDSPEDDVKAAKQLENAAYEALRKSAALFKKNSSVEDASKHLKGVLAAIKALDEV